MTPLLHTCGQPTFFGIRRINLQTANPLIKPGTDTNIRRDKYFPELAMHYHLVETVLLLFKSIVDRDCLHSSECKFPSSVDIKNMILISTDDGKCRNCDNYIQRI